MPLQKLQFRPGVNRENTNYTGEGGWFDCDKIRFRSGSPQKIGGWIKQGSGTFQGVCRNLVNWSTLVGENLIGVGTHLRYFINYGSIYHNITPLRDTPNTYTLGSNPFATTIGSKTVVVTAALHSAETGDFVLFSGTTGPIGGVAASEFNRVLGYQITYIDANSFSIELDAPATSTATGGGASVVAKYELEIGLPVYSIANGWGAPVWNGALLSKTTTLTANLSTGTATFTASFSGTTMTVSAVASGTIYVGMRLTASGLTTTDTYITALGTGSGGAGTYTVSTSQTLTSLTVYGVTRVNVLLAPNQTTINVTSTTGFTASGSILIDGEIITYSGVTATSFTGCTRGTSQTTAAFHSKKQTGPSTYSDVTVAQITSLSGSSGWGVASSNEFGVGLQMRLWSSDNYGEDLVLAPRGGHVYYWDKNVSTFDRAIKLSALGGGSYPYVPNQTNMVLVTDVSRFIVCLGSNPYSFGVPGTQFDPMLVRWSGQEDPTEWIPAITNQSGEQRLTTGSFIMTGAKMKQEVLIWTDAALYSMQYIGPPYVFGFNLLMSNLSIMSPNCVATVNNTAYWMGLDKFYMYNGRVETLPSSVRQYIYNDLAQSQAFQVFAGTNEGYNEVWWFYVSNSEVNLAVSEGRDPTVDKYVVYNHLENIWYYGTLSRTAWYDSPLQRGPLAAVGTTQVGQLVVHEQGVDDVTTDSPQPINAYIQSSDFDIGDGDKYMFIWRMLPDVGFDGSAVNQPSVDISLYPRQFPGSPYGTQTDSTVTSTQNYTNIKTYTVQQFTPQVFVRVRGRQMAFRIESTTLGVNWQLGSPRIDARTDGGKS